jgi:hypothetical protein
MNVFNVTEIHTLKWLVHVLVPKNKPKSEGGKFLLLFCQDKKLRAGAIAKW